MLIKAHNSATEKLQISKGNSEENHHTRENKLNIIYLTAQKSDKRSEETIKVYSVKEWLL